MNDVYLSLGSNIAPRLDTLDSGLNALIDLHDTSIQSISSIYETESVTLTPQSSYLNLAVCLKTKLDPEIFLKYCGLIEQSRGRPLVRQKNEPRSLDIDIIFFGDIILDSKLLQLPHPRYKQRRFVLVPLSEIAADLICPLSGYSITQILEGCDDTCDVSLLVKETI